MANIQGTSGNNYLVGTQGSDQIYGYAGNDTIIGGAGNDYLVGGSGNDILTGGSGRDTFVLNYSGGGIDTITDFSVKNDVLKVTTSAIGSSQNKSTPSSLTNYEVIEDTGIYPSEYVIGTLSSLSNYKVFEDAAIDFTKFTTGSLTLGSSDASKAANFFTYDASTGALFYLNQQLASLPLNLDWNTAVVVAARNSNGQ